MITLNASMHKARQLHNTGRLEEAKKLLECILESHPHHADSLHLLGIIAYQMDRTALSVQLIEQAIQSDPQSALFHSNLGEIYRTLGEKGLSIEYGKKALALDSNSATVWSNLGIAYYDTQHYELAKECHKKALAIHPNLGSSLNNMGSIYKACNQRMKAIKYYQAAIALAPECVEALNNLGVLFLEQQEFSSALTCLVHALKHQPTYADAYCNAGLALVGLDQYAKALTYFAQAIQLQPNYAQAYYGMAKAHLQCHDFAAAECFIGKALMLNPEEIEFYLFQAELSKAQGRYVQTLSYLDKALAIDETHAASHLSKANVLMEKGEFSQAKEHLAKITEDPLIDKRVAAHYSLVQLQKITKDNASLPELLTLVHQHTHDLSPSKLAYAYNALGKCYDDIGEWTTAFAYFSLGCQLKRKHTHYTNDEQIRWTQQLIHSFTQETIDYLQAFANPSTVPVFIVGMPRSGSTLVEQLLASHPHIYGAGELKYFNHLLQKNIPTYPKHLRKASSEQYHGITNNYLCALGRLSPDALRITDKMPHNFIALGIIYALFPNAKIIHIKRSPIATCWSCYTHLFTEGHAYSYDLTELGQYYQCYELLMEHWRSLLPTHAWLEITYETLVHNFDEEARRLIDYCDLPWDPACLNFHQSQRQVNTASFAQVRKPVYTSSIEHWRHYELQLTPLLSALAQQQL